MNNETSIENTISVEDAARRYLTSLWSVHYAENTVKLRRQHLRRFTSWLNARGIERAPEIGRELIECYRREMRARGVSAGSQETYLTTLRHFFAFLVAENIIETSPAATMTVARRPRSLPRDVLSHDEVERVLAGIDALQPLGLRDRAIFEMLYSSGLRRAEVLALDVADVDLHELIVRVRGGKGGKDRVVPLGARAATWVRAWLSSRSQLCRRSCSLLFVSSSGAALSERQLTRLGHEHVERALGGERGACHVFRHSVATVMLGAGADVRHVQELLGHADIRTTQRYTRVAIRDLKASHARFHPAA